MLLLIISAILPVAVFLFIIYKKDTLKEPLHLLIKCFFGGIIAIIPTVLIEIIFYYFNPFDGVFLSLLYENFNFGLTEELCKFIFLYLIIWKSPDFNRHYDGIIFSVCLSLGFAMLENISYVLQDGFGAAIGRAIFAVPMHGLCGIVMGYFLSWAKFSLPGEKNKYILLSICVPAVLHGLYNFLVFYAAALIKGHSIFGSISIIIFFFIFIAFLWRLGFTKLKEHLRKDKLPQ